jgi:hypothetical protein
MSYHPAGTLGRYLADVATRSGSPAGGAPAKQPGAEGAGTGASEQTKALAANYRKGWFRTSVWPWPPIAVTAIALAGYLFGWLGAIVVAGQTVATLLFVTGDSLVKKRTWLATSAVGVGAALVLVLLWQIHAIGPVRGKNTGQTSGPVDLAGHTVTQAMLKLLDLRGATLSGATLDHLVLTGKSLNGAVAPGSSFIGSNLGGVPMRGAELSGANFIGACLQGADLAGAELNGADIAGADITGLDLPASVMNTLVGKPAPSGARVSSCQMRAR